MHFKPEHRPGVLALVLTVIFGIPTWLVLAPEQFNLSTLGLTIFAVVAVVVVYKRFVEQAQPPARMGSVPAWVPKLVKVPAGPFLMGSSDADTLAYGNEKPQHTLTLPTYWIGKTPVTNAQFRPFVEGDGYTNIEYWTQAGWAWRIEQKISQPAYWEDAQWNGANQPVVGLSWYEAVAYLRWLSTQTGHPFRLPSEAEWEKAARGPDGRIYPWGDTWDAKRLNSGQKSSDKGKTTPVGQYPLGANPYRALDMAGNVYEWCATKHGKAYPYKLEDEWAQGYLAGEALHMLRGGSYCSDRSDVRGAFRYHGTDPRYRVSIRGLRVASDAPLPDAES
jgi:formylglycine-generating enzyme required for sulfatase activity